MEADADAALVCFIKNHKGGRSPKDEQKSYHSYYQVTVTINLYLSCYDKIEEKLSCFVIITNHQALSAVEILSKYRNQIVVENRSGFQQP